MLKIRVLLCLVLISGLGWFTDGETQEPGTLVRIAGGGEQEGEDIPAVDLKLELPLGLAIDPGGNMYIAELGGHRVRRVDAVTGRATTVAGTGKAGFSGDGAPATDAQLNGPQGVAVDSLGNLYIADTGNRRIRKVDAATGIITTIAGTGVFGFGGDGGLALDAVLGQVVALALDPEGGLYLSDGVGFQGRGNNRVRRIDFASGNITTVAGNGDFSYSGDGGPATEAGMTPEGIALDAAGNLYMADFNNHRIRRVDREMGIITTVVGRGGTIFGDGLFRGDGGPAPQAYLNLPLGVAVDAAGNLFVGDTENYRVRIVSAASGEIVTLAGTGISGAAGEGGIGIKADLGWPTRLVMDPQGNLLIVATDSNRILRLYDTSFRTPILSVSDTLLDFRTVTVGEPGLYSFRISNRGNKPLTVEEILAEPPEFLVQGSFPLIIGPSQTEKISVMFDPGGEGLIEGVLTLKSDDPNQPLVTVLLRGTGVFPDIGVSPDTLDFGQVIIGEKSERTLRISNLGEGELLVPRFTVSDSQFVANRPDTLRLQPGQVLNLTVSFQPGAADTQRAELKLFSNDPDAPVVTIPLWGLGQTPKPYGFASVGDSLGMADAGAGFGAAWADYDEDGDPDLYVVRGSAPNLLYRNDEGRFTEVGAAMGVADEGDGSGAAWADFDRDGDLDLYVTNYGMPNRLYRNDGNLFVEVGAEMGVADEGDSYGAAWADYDLDGDPDLYVANWGANRFYRNDRTSFVEMADSLGLVDDGKSTQPTWGDFDNDGDPDLFLANWGPNRLFLNEAGRFVDETSRILGSDLGQSSGATWGDFNNDGYLDLCVTYFDQRNLLFWNLGGRFFEADWLFEVDSSDPSHGAAWGDIDNDGDLDLCVTNSARSDRIYLNEGGRYFSDVSENWGVADQGDSRAVAMADFDGDGGLDLFVAVQNGPDRIYRNRGVGGNWLAVHLKGTTSSSDAIGARIEIVTDGKKQIREISGGSSYLSQNDLTAFFGVGEAARVDTLTVRWPSGTVQRMEGVEVNRALEIIEISTPVASRLRLEAPYSTLIANNSSMAEILAYLVDAQGNPVLANNVTVTFSIDAGTGGFYSTNIVRVQDGKASVIFGPGFTPGLAVVSASAPGVETGHVAIDLLPPLELDKITIRTVAGSGGQPDYSGDGGSATRAMLRFPRTIAIDSIGNLYIADAVNNRIRRVDAFSGIIETVAGDGIYSSTGDGGPALDARVGNPSGLTFLANGDLLIVESHRIRRLNIRTNTIEAFAGRSISGFGGDGGPATLANLTVPEGITADKQGNVWIADRFNNRIRKVDIQGTISTVAGVSEGSTGDGGPAVLASLNQPQGVVVDQQGQLYIADTGNHRVRKIDGQGIITTLVGTGVAGYGGDGGPGALAFLDRPQSVALDEVGHLFIADTGNHRVRMLDLSTGLIQTIAGTGTGRFNMEAGSAAEVHLDSPSDVEIGPSGHLFIADRGNNSIRELLPVFPDTPAVANDEPTGSFLAADFDRNGKVGFEDFILFARNYGSSQAAYDLSGNGAVDFADFILFAKDYGREFESVLDEASVEFKPHPIRIVTPEYPEVARRAGLEGTVRLKVLVGSDGLVKKVEVLDGPEVFYEASMEAAWQFVFRPARQNGVPVAVWMIMPITFKSI